MVMMVMVMMAGPSSLALRLAKSLASGLLAFAPHAVAFAQLL